MQPAHQVYALTSDACVGGTTTVCAQIVARGFYIALALGEATNM